MKDSQNLIPPADLCSPLVGRFVPLLVSSVPVLEMQADAHSDAGSDVIRLWGVMVAQEPQNMARRR